MKPYFGGKLFDSKESPFKKELTVIQCLEYAINRPGVIAVCPGIESIKELDELLLYFTASLEEKDYSVINTLAVEKNLGVCVYCKHCQPCPVGIDIGLVNKYYDLALVGDLMAKNHYSKLKINASACISCGHCNNRCPFKVKQQERIQEIKKYFKIKFIK